MPAAGRPWWRLALEATGVFTLVACLSGGQRFLFALRDGRPAELWLQLVNSLALWLPWVPLALLIVALARRFPLEGPGWRRSLAVHLSASVLFAPLKLMVYIPTLMVFEVVFDLWRTATPLEIPGRILGYLLIETIDTPVLYWVVLGVVSIFSFHRRLQERELSESRLEAQLAEARIQALRRQLNPHFLFNTLNAVAALMHRDVSAAELMLDRLSELLRASLEADDRPLATLSEEIALTRLYLDIERERFADRLGVVVEVPCEAEDALVPRLLLQPLVENAVRHGIAPLAAGGTVTVRGAVSGGRLELVVEDDGVGIGRSRSGGSGVGLRNPRERLEALYGPDATMVVGAGAEGGTVVTIGLPLRFADDRRDGGERPERTVPGMAREEPAEGRSR